MAHSLRVLSITGRKTLWEEEEAGHTAPVVRKQREMHAAAQLLLPCVCSLGPQPMEILARRGLLCSDKSLWKHPPSHPEVCFHGDSTSLPATMTLTVTDIIVYLFSPLSTWNSLPFEKHEIPTWYLPTVYDFVQKQRPFLVWSKQSLHCYGEKHPGQPFDTLTGFNPALRKRNAFEPVQVLCLPSPSL